MTFTGWTGACTGLSTTCAVTASDGLLVVANFRAAFTAVTSYYHLDALGSVRAITDAAGAVVARHDFRPFGADTEPLPGAGTDARRFAGEERDGTGLDYLGARYFSMATARFTSVDPIVSPAAMIDPQKWNRYAYARNNPLRFVDPTGMDDEDRDPVEIPIPPCSEECQTFDLWADGVLFYHETYTKMLMDLPLGGGPAGTPLAEGQKPKPNDPLVSDATLKFWSDLAAGLGSGFTGGLLDLFRMALSPSTDAVIDRGSKAYLGGAVFGTVGSFTLGNFLAGPQSALRGMIWNQNNYSRMGWGYQKGVGDTFRLVVGNKQTVRHAHLDLYPKDWLKALVDFADQLLRKKR